jgi:membrane protein YdbS with pleckstrin-like domain
LWGKIHGFDKLPKEIQQKMMKMMGPTYAIQFFITLVTSFVLAIFLAYQPGWNAYVMVGFLWIGFVVPAQVSGVMFGGTENKWMVKKVAVQAGASLGCLEIAALVLHLM